MIHVFDDAGRAAAGMKGPGDCVTRSIAIASRLPYREVHDRLRETGRGVKAYEELFRTARGERSIRDLRRVYEPYLIELGYAWHETKNVRMRPEELPAGTIIARCSRHLCAIVDGTVRDVYDPSRDGSRLLSGYWQRGE